MTETNGIGSRFAPPRFLIFLALFAIGCAIAIGPLGWRIGPMVAFDLAGIVFLVSLYPLFDDKPDEMRANAKRNDANRAGLLAVTGVVSLVVLVSIASELSEKGAPKLPVVLLIVATLALSWLFSNTIYALHYAHVFYGTDDGGGTSGGEDAGGLKFPETDEPDYTDFAYFAICLGMTFQTSDVNITTRRMRRIVTAHCLAAFVFNLGVVAFTINVLGGG